MPRQNARACCTSSRPKPIRSAQPTCFARPPLSRTWDVLPTSRLEEGRDRRLAGQLKRLQRKVDEATKRRDDPIDATEQVAAIEALRPAAKALPAPTATADVFEIDLLTWNKDQ